MSRPGRRAAGWTTLVAGLGALAVGLVLLLRPPAAPPDAGALPAPAVVVAPSAVVPVRAVPALWTPTELTIGRLRVSAPVEPVGVTGTGVLEVPADPDRLGWWFGSALPGDRRGTVLIAGHVDTAEDGRGALYRLETLPVGARVEVRAGEQTIGYRVEARRSYAKSRLPRDLFRRDTAPRLVLITCGGEYPAASYAPNVVAYPPPAPPADRAR